MHVTQTLNEGLKLQFKVLVSAADLTSRFDTELEGMRGKVNLNGFRPGKVPIAHLKRMYGKSVMADVVQNAVNDANKKIVDENALRLAGEPKINLPEDKVVIDQVLEGKADLDFSVDLEILPKVEIVDHSAISVVRETVTIPEQEIEEAITRMAKANAAFTPRAEGEAAASGDKVTIDFLGTIDGVAFSGGTASDAELVLGSNQFIPGFEDQLIGAKIGDQVSVKVAFPADYQAAELAGKDAEFATSIKAISAPGAVAIDDDLAKKFGLDDVAKLREAVESSLSDELKVISHQKVKRQLLDGLDALYTFELPPTMLEAEFAQVWGQLQQDMQREKRSFEQDGTSEEAARAEYQKIAARRVRLGLVLAEIGEKAEVKIADDELTQALIARARNFPGQEKQVFEYYRKNPQALAELRAPLFEEKVIQHILAGVSVTDKSVTREELTREEAGAE
jgi:trigger factor